MARKAFGNGRAWWQHHSAMNRLGVLAFAMTLAFALAFVLPAQAQAGEQLELGAIAAQDASDTTTLGVQVKYGQSEARSMLDLVNQFRSGEITDGGQSTVWAYASNGSVDTASYQNLGSLTYDYELEKVAMRRAAEIALQYSHARPNGLDCFSAFPDGYSTKGENIAAGYGNGGSITAQGAFNSWCETNYPYSGQGHRRNMLGSSYNRIGIGHVVVHWSGTLTEGTRPYPYSVDIHYWVQEFGYRNDSVGLAAISAQDDTTAHPVDVEVSNDNIQSVALTASASSFTLGYGDTTTFDGVSCGVRACDPGNSDNHTWPDQFNLTWTDGETSKGTYSVPVDVPYSLQSSDESVVSVSDHEVTGVSVGSANLVASTDLASGAETTVPVTVTSKTLSSATLTLSAETFTYDGTAKQPGVTVSVNGVELKEGTDYTVAYKNNVYAGSATLTVTGKGNYAGSAQATFTIEPATVAIPSAVEGLIYNGAEQVGVATGSGYSVTGESATNAGPYTATASLPDSVNYAWSDGTTAEKTIQWSIAPKPVVVTSCNATKVYSEQDPAFEAAVEGLLGNDSLSYDFERAPGEGVGSYRITPTGDALQGNYSVTYQAEGVLTITKAASAIFLADEAKSYNGEVQAYGGSVTRSGSSGTISLEYFSDEACENPVGASDVKNAGTYYVRATLAADDNYESATSETAKLTIEPKSVTVTVVGKSGAVTYTGAVQAISGFSIESDDPNYDVSKVVGPEQEGICASGTDVGTYEIPIESAAFTNSDTNYNVTFIIASSTILTIGPASIEGAALVLDTSGAPYVYSGDSQKPAVQAVGEWELVEGTDFEVEYSGPDENCANAGTYTVVAVGKGNYTGASSSAEYTIGKATSSASITDASETYAGEAIAYNGEMTLSGSGGEVSFAYFGDAACENPIDPSTVKNAGTYFVKATLAADENHEGATSNVAEFTIKRASAVVKADNKSKTYGEDDPTLTATVEGCFGNDASDIVYELNRVAGEDVREDGYDIQVRGSSVQGNYDVSFENGALVIDPRPVNVVITGESESVVYDGTEHAIAGYAISGLDGTGLLESDIVPVDGLVAEARGTGAGSYAMGLSESSFSVSNSASRNYAVSIAVVDGHLSIAKAPSSISIPAQAKTYNAKAQTYSGKVTKSGSSGAVTYAYYSDAACTRAATPKAAGTYYVRATVAADDNYASATSAAAKFTINKAANPMVFKAQTKTVKYAKLKKAKQVVAITKASRAQGAVTYKKVKVNKKAANFAVNKTTGKITVKKGTPKGTYKVTVQAYAKGNANYKPSAKVKRVITIKVK